MAAKKYDVQKLYAATNGGLDIISDYCPDAQDACRGQNTRLHFCFSAERTPSAHLFKTEGNWIVKDFSNGADTGRNGKTGVYDPIAVFCKSEGYDRQADFPKIMEILYSRYGLSGEEFIDEQKNQPVFDDPVPAPADMEEGEWRWSEVRALNETERKVMGKHCTAEILKELCWYAVDSIGKKKNGMIRWKHSTPDYPILCRECIVYDEMGAQRGSFFKFYEPLNPKKQYRFYVADKNHIKPTLYVNNIGEYNTKYARYRSDREEGNILQPDRFLEQGVVICCGERDAIACRSMGWWPIWLNSETAEFPNAIVRLIRKQNPRCPIYYIPDLDVTGQEMMRKLAKDHPDFWIVELPHYLKDRKDNRGKPMKDLRDWLESERDMDSWKFSQFMETAHRVQFWDVVVNDKTGERKVRLDTDCLHFFLRVNGIEPISDMDMDTVEFGRHVNEYIIEQMDMKKVNDFVMDWASRQLLPRQVKNALLDGAKLDEAKLKKMLATTYNFVCHTKDSQIVYFKDRLAMISASGIELLEPKKASESESRVWQRNVIDRPLRFITHEEKVPLKDKWGRPILDEKGTQRMVSTMVRTKLFHYTREYDKDKATYVLDITISPEAYKSPAFCMLCATSHIYWQDEEAILEGKGSSHDEIKQYWKENWYKLDSPMLTTSKRYEQMASLISKLFVIGYYGWDYNSPSTPWAAYIMDDFDGEGSNGGSGKSLLFSFINQYKQVEFLNGRRKENSKDKHIFGSVTPRTRVVLFDDFIGHFSDWYQAMSSGLRVEPKGKDAYTMPRERSPKLAFTTNGTTDKQSSSIRRQIRATCSSFFHNEGNGFEESRSPSEFCGNLWDSDYTPEKWRYDDNIFLECIEEAMPFIRDNIKIEPPLERVNLRALRRQIGKASIEWFDDYFRPSELTHANKFVSRSEYVEDYKRAMAGKGEYTTDLDLLEKTAKWVAYRSWAVGYCPKGVPGWCGDLKGEYRHSRIIQNGVEGIYIATLDNEEEQLQYLKREIEAEAIEEATNPALENEPF